MMLKLVALLVVLSTAAIVPGGLILDLDTSLKSDMQRPGNAERPLHSLPLQIILSRTILALRGLLEASRPLVQPHPPARSSSTARAARTKSHPRQAPTRRRRQKRWQHPFRVRRSCRQIRCGPKRTRRDRRAFHWAKEGGGRIGRLFPGVVCCKRPASSS